MRQSMDFSVTKWGKEWLGDICSISSVGVSRLESLLCAFSGENSLSPFPS